MLDLSYEQTLWNQGVDYIIGIDEVGRGPLAGPVIVGAVVFDKTHKPISGINDSKKIPKKSLKNISDTIKSECRVWSVGCGSVELINEKGIIFALQHAISEAITELQITNNKSRLVIDGLPYKDIAQFSNQCRDLHRHQYVIYQPKADGTIYSVAAASIIAKTYRDELMANLAQQHPEYGWEKNAGYGTKTHREAIQKYGLTKEHRELFCRKYRVKL